MSVARLVAQLLGQSAYQSRCCCLMSALLCLPVIAQAERADRDKPTLLEGKHCVSEELKQVSVCRGNVLLVRGTLRITGERMEVRQDPEGYVSATVTGTPQQVATFRQRRDAVKSDTEEYVEGFASRIEYDERAENVRFIERARWRRLENDQLRDEVSGSLISYDSGSATYNVEGSKSAANPDGRVRMILSPRDSSTTAPANSATRSGASAQLKPDATIAPDKAGKRAN